MLRFTGVCSPWGVRQPHNHFHAACRIPRAHGPVLHAIKDDQAGTPALGLAPFNTTKSYFDFLLWQLKGESPSAVVPTEFSVYNSTPVHARLQYDPCRGDSSRFHSVSQRPGKNTRGNGTIAGRISPKLLRGVVADTGTYLCICGPLLLVGPTDHLEIGWAAPREKGSLLPMRALKSDMHHENSDQMITIMTKDDDDDDKDDGEDDDE